LPFVGPDPTDLCDAVCNKEPEPLTAPPKWLREAVAKALTKEPGHRYQTTSEMRAALNSQAPAIEIEPTPPLFRQASVAETPLRREPRLPVAVNETPLRREPKLPVAVEETRLPDKPDYTVAVEETRLPDKPGLTVA